ncbi:hypothetical protein [Phenylobacterium sp.]|uniref:hypothetical protein n=1 Tax=Phenylobacterium sp. TaxID=1871053 RepID=UPI0011FFDA43|nr:hypothetical protein [Phenylobacterium sp.]THD61261.1 MAG: hypothetical protein E8A49_09645 [Phenylobacterium sp.]
MREAARYRLSLHADPLPDGLARILNVVALQPVALMSVRHDQSERRATSVLEFETAAPDRAALLAARLRQAIWMHDVQLRGVPPQPADPQAGSPEMAEA